MCVIVYYIKHCYMLYIITSIAIHANFEVDYIIITILQIKKWWTNLSFYN